jgi:hypothetical protein
VAHDQRRHLLAPLLALPALTIPVQRVLAPTRVWIYLPADHLRLWAFGAMVRPRMGRGAAAATRDRQ